MPVSSSVEFSDSKAEQSSQSGVPSIWSKCAYFKT